MSRRREWYTAQQVRNHLDGNFAIPEDGFDSNIEGFKSDSDDDLEPQLPPQEQENNNIALRNVIVEDEEEEGAENSNVRAARRPSNYSFNDFFFGNQVKTFNTAQVQEHCGSVTSVNF